MKAPLRRPSPPCGLRLALAGLVAAVLVGCGATIPDRPGYDRGTGTWGGRSGASGSGSSRSSGKPAVVGSTERGQASFYGREFEGRPTASGEPYAGSALTCAHPSHPFGTRLRVRYLKTGRETEVRVNDRGPFKAGRIVDLSRAAAEAVGLVTDGVGDVELEVLGGPP